MAAANGVVAQGDEQLLARAARGDRDALDELFRRYRLVAYRVAYRLLGNEADALDAVQEAFVKALTHLTGFEGRSSFKTWLLRVVSNASLDLGRQRGRREALSFDAMGPLGQHVVSQHSTDFLDWTDFATNTIADDVSQGVTDSGNSGSSFKYYRLRLQ